MNKPDSPGDKLKARTPKAKTDPKPPADYGRDSAEISTSSTSEQTTTNNASSQPEKKAKVFVVQLNTRIAHPYQEMLQELSKRDDKTIRSLIENALEQTYGTPEGL